MKATSAGRGLFLALQVSCLALFIACRSPEAGDGIVRLVDAWLSPPDSVSSLESLTLSRVTRMGIPLRVDGSSERFAFRTPRAAEFDAILGIRSDPGMDSVEPVEVSFSASICSANGGEISKPPLFHLEVEGSGWYSIHFGLGSFSGDEIELCTSVQASRKVSIILAAGEVAIPEHEDWQAERPNLLLITLHAARDDRLGRARPKRDTSPRLDRLASEGEQYLNAVTNSPWTVPNHASLFTGKHPREHGARSHVRGTHSLARRFFGLQKSEMTLSERLFLLGYRTGAVVAGPALRAEFGLSQGFGYYEETRTPDQGSFRDVEAFDVRGGGHVTDLALDWLRESRSPFFLFLNYFDADIRKLANNDDSSVLREVMTTERDLGDSERETMAALDDARILAMDRAMGRLFDALRTSGDYDRTMIVVVSDHGQSFGEHQTVGHGLSLYEERLRATVIVKYPAMEGRYSKGQRFDHRVDLLDTHATILREIGLAIGSDRPARSSPRVRARGIPAYGLHKIRTVHFAELYRNPPTSLSYRGHLDGDLEAVYRGHYKLIRSEKGRLELFDLDVDPGESENLAATETQIVKELEEELDEWGADSLRQYGAESPAPVSLERPE